MYKKYTLWGLDKSILWGFA